MCFRCSSIANPTAASGFGRLLVGRLDITKMRAVAENGDAPGAHLGGRGLLLGWWGFFGVGGSRRR